MGGGLAGNLSPVNPGEADVRDSWWCSSQVRPHTFLIALFSLPQRPEVGIVRGLGSWTGMGEGAPSALRST